MHQAPYSVFRKSNIENIRIDASQNVGFTTENLETILVGIEYLSAAFEAYTGECKCPMGNIYKLAVAYYNKKLAYEKLLEQVIKEIVLYLEGATKLGTSYCRKPL